MNGHRHTPLAAPCRSVLLKVSGPQVQTPRHDLTLAVLRPPDLHLRLDHRHVDRWHHFFAEVIARVRFPWQTSHHVETVAGPPLLLWSPTHRPRPQHAIRGPHDNLPAQRPVTTHF